MTTTPNMPAAPEVTVPRPLLNVLKQVQDVEATFTAAQAEHAHDAIKIAPTVAAEFDNFATSVGGALLTKAGKVIDSRTLEAIAVKHGAIVPSVQTMNRYLNIGRFVTAGQEEATWKRYTDAVWTQPDDAVADGASPVKVTNDRTLTALSRWARILNGGTDNNAAVHDDVLITNARHAELCKPIAEVEQEQQQQQQEQQEQERAEEEAQATAPATAPTPAAAAVTNTVNRGAMAAVFAKCDDATVASVVDDCPADFSAIEDRDMLVAIALGALAAATLIQRAEDRESEQPVEEEDGKLTLTLK